MAGHTLRPYQETALRGVLDAWRAGARSVLLVMPTGSGKTSLFTSLASGVPSGVLIVAHRRELVTQAARRLEEFGVDHGLVLAGAQRRPWARVQVGTVQTLVRRDAPPAGLVIFDEAHLSTAGSWTEVRERYPSARVLGVTATPWRLGGKPLIGAYDAVVVGTTPAELREAGYLCSYQGFGYLAPDLSGVKTKAGEYDEKQSGEAMKQPQIVANIVEKWQEHAAHLSTVAFCVTVEHSQALTAEFIAAGVRAEHLDGTTPRDAREAIFRRVESGETRVLCNVGIAIEGIDIPRLKCLIDANPTKSLARFIQKCGRIRRPWRDQVARIHDHAFNIRMHGLPDDPRDYTLRSQDVQPPSMTQCQNCLAWFRGDACAVCSTARPTAERGDRELTSVPDAESFAFDSSSGVTATPGAALPPVEIRWEAVGKVVEGIYERSFDDAVQWGTAKRYLVRGKRRSYVFTGSAKLNPLMAQILPGAKVRVTYTGNREIGGGRTMRLFKVEIDRC